MSSYPGVYVEEFDHGHPPIAGMTTSTTALVGIAPLGPVDEPVSVTSFAAFEQQFGGLRLESSLGFAVRDFFLNGGNQAIILRVLQARPDLVGDANFIGPGKEAASQGLYALKKAEFNLLCIPPYKQNDVDTTVIAAAAKLCEDRRAFLLIDSPSSWSSKDLAKRESRSEQCLHGLRHLDFC